MHTRQSMNCGVATTSPPAAQSLRLAVGVATRGRSEVLVETLQELTRQIRAPDRIVVAHVAEADVAGTQRFPQVECLTAPIGSSSQRNVILGAVDDCDIILFLDDDFLPGPDYIAATLCAFHTDPRIVVTTGRVLADGARGPGIDAATGRSILAQAPDTPPMPALTPTFNGYGCNMALRLDAIRANGLHFDERLPLYAWFEDVDLCRRLAAHGSIVEVAAAVGVHLGVKAARTSGRRLGYSQVINPLYLWRKGSLPLGRALRGVGRHLLINGIRTLRPEPWVDRRGRFAGNGLALLDIIRGRAAPERILDL